MALIQFDSQRAYLIPDDKREDYFKLVDLVAKNCPGAMSLDNIGQAWNTDNDPILIICADYFSPTNWGAIIKGLEKIGAREITEEVS